MKKKTSRKNPGVRSYTVGKGFTEKRKYSIDLAGSLSPEGRAIFEKGPKGVNPFDGSIAPVEASAIRVLEQAGLPTDSSGFYTIPEGEKVPMPRTHEEAKAVLSRSSERMAGGLLDLVKARGKRERVDSEWYAAEILWTARAVRANIGDPWTSAALAAGLGELVGEAKAWGYFSRVGGKNKGKKKALPPVAALVRSLIRKNRKANATELWEMVPTDSVDGIKINGHKFYRNGGRLLALRKVDGCKDWRPVGKSLRYSAFRNRVTAARKTLTR